MKKIVSLVVAGLGMSYLTMPIKGVEVPVTKTRFT